MPRPARPWFRVYVEAMHDPKLRRIKPEYRWLYIACLAAARQSPEPGILMVGKRAMDAQDIADLAGMSARAVHAGMRVLRDNGLIVPGSKRDRGGIAWRSPTWNDRQYESDDVAKRTRKHRTTSTDDQVGTFQRRSNAKDRNVPTSFPGTPPETETETENTSAKFGARANPIFDALVTACGWDYTEMTDKQRRSTGVAAAELAKVGATPEQIHVRASAYTAKFRTAALTPHALANNWAALNGQRPTSHVDRTTGARLSQEAIGRS